MLLKIDVPPEDIIYNERGRIIIKVHFYAQYAHGAHLATTHGETKEEFDKNKGLGNKTLFVGSKGGLSLA